MKIHYTKKRINFTIEDFTDADSGLEKRVYKDFEVTRLGKYNYFYLQNYTLLLLEVSKSF